MLRAEDIRKVFAILGTGNIGAVFLPFQPSPRGKRAKAFPSSLRGGLAWGESCAQFSGEPYGPSGGPPRTQGQVGDTLLGGKHPPFGLDDLSLDARQLALELPLSRLQGG
jgi:hypothetical protein